MSNQRKGIFEFGQSRLDVQEGTLQVAGNPVPLTPKVFELLVLLVENPGRLLEKEWILKALWPDTFVEEANLSVNISTLRKALGSFGEANYIETVPKRGYRFTATVTQIQVEPAEASRNELSARVIISTSKPEPTEPGKPFEAHKVRWIAVIALAVVAIAAAGWLAGRSRYSVQKLSEVRSIAVLPFRSLANNDDPDYLGAGMADALIGRLSMIHGITVRPTAAVQKYYGKAVDPLAAGRDLRVDVVLDGSVQRSAKMIRVSVQLLRVQDGSPLWAERFDDYFTNIFDVQESISEKVAVALSMKLTENEHRMMVKRQTANTEAYQLYVKGRYLAFKRSADGMPDASVALYQQAIAKDPDYALAYAALASAYLELATMRGQSDAIQRARSAALKALSLSDDLEEAHLAQGAVLMRADWDWIGAGREFDRALAIEPNSAQAHWSKSILTMALGQTEPALLGMQLAHSLDPTSQTFQDDLGWAYYCNRRWTEAIQESKMAAAAEPNSFAAHHQLGKAYLHAGQYEAAKAEFETTKRLHPLQRGFADLGQLYAMTGNPVKARAILLELERAESQSPTYESAFMRAVLYASLGDKDSAFRALDTACAQKLSRAIWMRVDPDLDPLRSDPRFDALLRRVRL